MKTMLIAVGSDIITQELMRVFQGKYQVYTCGRGDDTLRILQELKPDILIINLSLSNITGLSVLQHTTYKSPVIIALTNYLSDRLLQAVQAVEAGALIRFPCSIECIISHLNRLLNK
ncbi:MAG: response regulator [Oscillospiraceae bacterium]|nr:response regulator [Oscillospiraceae bacterium]